MAGYRPKSLEELNNMYDKTMAAEKAIRKGTSLLENSEEKPEALSGGVQDTPVSEKVSAQPAELSDAVNDFIAKYSETPAAKRFTAEMPAQKQKPHMTVLTPENPVTETAPVEKIDFPTVPQNTPQSAVTREQTVRRADRDELMDEYMKIMSDEDDDVPEKKISRKEKKKKKKRDRGSFSETENVQETPVTEVPAEEIPVVQEFQHTENEEPPVVDFYSQNEVKDDFISEEKDEAEEKNDFDFPEDYTPEWIEKDMTEAEEKKESHKKGKKARKNKKDKKKQLQQEVPVETEEEPIDDIESQKAEFEEAFSDEEEEVAETENKKSGGKTFLKIFMSIILVLLVVAGGFATSLKTVFSINTGKAFNDSTYIFTAYKNYDDLSLKEGDLLLTEKIYAEDGDIFAYIDYSEKTFEFGKRLDSITNDDGEVLIVTEKNGSRVLVSRDDCKGVLKTVYPQIGKYVSFITDNYIVVISVIAVVALIIVLVLSNGFKSKKGKNTDIEEQTETEEEFENVFSTID